MTDRFCPSCGNMINNQNARFCSICGERVGEVRPAADAAVVSEVSYEEFDDAPSVKTTGSNLLLVSGIIMIVGASIGLTVGFISVFGAFAGTALFGGYMGAGLTVYLLIASLMSLTGSAIELAAGIMGCMWKNRRDKAKYCLIMGIACAGTILFSFIVTLCTGVTGKIIMSFFSLFFGSVLPVLYIVGAYRNMK